MSNYSLSHQARVVALIIPLAALAACASHKKKDPAPPPNAVDPASVVVGKETSIENMLAARFPGVSVSPASGGGLQIRIRGGSNSFYGGEEPLYIVDETPLPTGTGGIVFVNPYDIQRIEVLKNPADVAIYGIRGANGVIKITTKKQARTRTP